MADEATKEEAVMAGAFVESLTRNNRQIKGDRALAIAEDTEVSYKRAVEDLEREVKLMKRKQAGMLDLSGDNAMSLKPVNDFDPDEFMTKDLALSLLIRNTEIKLELAKTRYNFLFGGKA